MIQAVATLISGGHGFFLGAIGQKRLLDKFCPQVPHVIMIERNAYSDECIKYLHKIGSQIKIVNAIRMKKKCSYAAKRWRQTFTKLNLWTLAEFEHVLFMDADAYPYSEDIFSKFKQFQPEFLAATTFRDNIGRFRSGMMVVKPDTKRYQDLCKFAWGDPAENGAKLGDQGILNCYVDSKDIKWTRVPYNWHTVVWSKNPKNVIIGHIRPKPWGNTCWEKNPKATRTLSNRKTWMHPYVNAWKQAILDTEEEHGPVPRGNLT